MRRIILGSLISLAAIFSFADEFVPCFIDDENPKIRYNFRYIHEDYTIGGEIAITSVAVNPDMRNSVDITPGEYAYSWGQLKIQEIDARAFKGCEKIRKITLPGTLRTVNNQAFESCKDLEEVTFQELDSGRLSLGSAVFNNCTNLTTVRFANKISSLGGLTFYGCRSLRQVDFGTGLSKVLNGTFEGCTSIETVTFNRNLSSIGTSTFNGCTNLKEVYFKGACPIASQDIYLGSPEDIITIAEGDATGWPTNDTQWMGRPFAFVGISICTPRPQEEVGQPVVLTTPREDLGYVVKYTTDGTAPSATNGMVYSGAFYVNSDVTVRAVGIRNGRVGPTVTRSFQGDTMMPTMHVIACSDGMQTIAFSNRTDNATIYYSLDSDALNTAARCYTEPFNVTNHAVVNAFSVRDGRRNSLSQSWNIADCPVVFDPNGGNGGGVRMCTSNASIGPLPDVSRDGYIFEGWFTDIGGGQEITSGTVISCPITVYARWRESEAQLTIVKGVLTRVVLNGASHVIIPDGVTKIGDSAFYCLWNLKSVTIPSSVKSIGVSAFDGCSGLSEVVIPDGVEEIKSWAFSGCTGLTSVRMNNVTTIGEYAFYLCRRLSSVSLGLSNAAIGYSVFNGCHNLTAFCADNDNIRYATEDGLLLTKNKKQLVWVPGGLTAVSIPYGVEIVGKYAFCHGTKLVSVDIPDTVTEIGESAFAAQRNLKSIIIPDSVKKIGSSAFYGCSGLSEVCVPSRVTSDSGGSIFSGCTNLQTAVVQDGVECIGDGWFSGCSNLISITIPLSVKTIGAGAFGNCVSLRGITIPRAVTYIGWNAFRGCENLQSLIIPSAVTYIGGYAFLECENLAEVYLSEDYTETLDNVFPTGVSLIRYKPSQTVYLDASGGSLSVGSVSAQYGTPYGSLPVPVKHGFVFRGWYLNGRLITSEDCVLELGASHTLVAQWEPEMQCEVTFDANGGTVSPSSKTVTCNATYGTLPIPAYAGHTFGGWYTARQDGVRISSSTEVFVTEAHTLYAHWTANQYQVTFDANGGTVSPSSKTVTCNAAYGTLPIPAYAGHTFDGWYTECQEGTKISDSTEVSITEAHTLYAHWLVSQYEVIFDANGGLCEEADRTVAHGSRIGTLPIPTRDDATFLGWFTDVEGGDEIDSSLVITEAGTFYAHWMITQYLISFDANGGELLESSRNVTGGNAIGELPTPTRDGYRFVGWYTLAEGGVAVTAQTVVSEATTYYAHWDKIPNYIIYEGMVLRGDALEYVAKDVTEVTIPDGVTSIDDWAFYECFDLTSVTIPDTVTNIGVGAFYECGKLANVAIGAGVTDIGAAAFYNCESLESVAMPDGTRIVGDYAFSGCGGLTSIAIPCSVTYIGSCAFDGCTNVADVVMPGWIMDIPFESVTNLVFSDGVTSIKSYAFIGCSGLKSVTVPTSVTNIGEYAFCFCDNLVRVTMPDGLATVGVNAFDGTPFYENLPDGLVIFGKVLYKMKGACPAIVTIPDNVTSITRGAFSYCSGLVSFSVNDSNANYKSVNGLLLSKDGKTLVAGVHGDVAIPDGVTCIGPDAFCGFRGLSSVMMPESVTNIGECAFEGCSGLMSVTIPESVTSIGSYAFYHCSGLTGITIPGSVTSIGDNAFSSCSGLTSVAIPNSVTSIGSCAFYGCNGLTTVYLSDNYTGPTDVFPSNAAILRYKHNQTVYFDANGGSVSQESTAVLFGRPYGELPVPSRIECEFIGWALSGDIIDSETMVSELDDHTLVAQWKANQYVMTFNANGGTGGKSVTLNYGSSLSAPTVTRTGYTFKGWSPSVPSTVPAGNATYTAQWLVNKYTVTFDANGGTCGTAELGIDYGTSVGELPVPVRDNAVFLGWFTEAEGGVKVDADTVVTGELVLYAHWLFEVEPPVVVSSEGNPFRAESCEVSIKCATEGAAIYYTDDGTTPRLNDDYLYTGPFTITDTTVIKAIAVFQELRSGYVTTTIEKHTLTFEEALGSVEGVAFATGGDALWSPIVYDAAKRGDICAKSGAIGNKAETWLSATVEGAGAMTFWCKTSCEHDEDNMFTWDRLMIYTNGVEIAEWRMDGGTDWTERVLSFEGGVNTVKWVYYKDRTGADGEDCAWIDAMTWTPSAAADPIPTVTVDADAATVNAAVDGAGFVDAAVKVAIGGSAAEYNKFKTWAAGVKGATGDAFAGEAAVVANEHAAAAYLLGAERLFVNEPTVEIGELAIVDGESAGTTAMTVAVTVKDGASAVAVDAAKVAAMFEATGDLGDWSGAAKLTPTVTTSGTDASGKMTFVVTPGDGTAAKAFLRIRK